MAGPCRCPGPAAPRKRRGPRSRGLVRPRRRLHAGRSGAGRPGDRRRVRRRAGAGRGRRGGGHAGCRAPHPGRGRPERGGWRHGRPAGPRGARGVHRDVLPPQARPLPAAGPRFVRRVGARRHRAARRGAGHDPAAHGRQWPRVVDAAGAACLHPQICPRLRVGPGGSRHDGSGPALGGCGPAWRRGHSDDRGTGPRCPLRPRAGRADRQRRSARLVDGGPAPDDLGVRPRARAGCRPRRAAAAPRGEAAGGGGRGRARRPRRASGGVARRRRAHPA